MAKLLLTFVVLALATGLSLQAPQNEGDSWQTLISKRQDTMEDADEWKFIPDFIADQPGFVSKRQDTIKDTDVSEFIPDVEVVELPCFEAKRQVVMEDPFLPDFTRAYVAEQGFVSKRQDSTENPDLSDFIPDFIADRPGFVSRR